MNFRRLTSLFFIFSLFVQGAAAADFKIPDSVNIAYTKVTLENGLTVIISEDHKAPIVAVNIWYHVGSKNEPKGKNGFAHLFEHLMFQGSENFNDDYFKGTQKIGATDLNGTTNEDRTNYFESVPSSALDTALFLESDRMGHFVNAISQAKLDEQREVVLNEKRQGQNRPYWGVAEERISKGVFPAGHPYSWTTIGSEEDLNGASLTDVKEWFKTYYGPSNATLTIVGDVKTQDALAKVKKYFGDIPPGPRLARTKEWIAKRTESKIEVAQDYVPFAKLIKVYNIPGIGSPELDALDVASDVLTIGKTSRLFKEIVYDKQLANDISASVSPNEIASLFVIDATAKEGVTLEQLDAAINETMQNFFKKGPTEEELKRVKAQFVSGFIQSLEKVGGFGGKANLLASNQVFLDNPSAYRKKLDERLAFTSDDIRKAGQKWLTSGDYNLHIYPFPKFASDQKGADRKMFPLPTSYPDAKFPSVEEAKLSNGMRVLLARRTHIPTVELSLLFKAGFMNDPKDKKGLGRLTFDLLDEGTKKNTLFQIENKLANLGSGFESFAGMKLSGVFTKSLKQNFEPTMDILEETLLTPLFSGKELERLRRETLQGIQQEKANPDALNDRLFTQLVYGNDHPFAIPSGTGTPKTIAKITRDDVVNFYNTWAKPNNATVIAIGDITMDELTKSLEKHFHSWKKSDLPKFEIPSVSQEANRGTLFIVDRPYAPQTTIAAGEFYPSFNDPKQVPNFVMNAILGGSFTSRINMNLREDKRWSYGARSSFTDLEGSRMFVVEAPVQTDKTDLSVAEIQKEMSGIVSQSKPITADEFEKQRTAVVLQLSGVWESNHSLFDPIKKLLYNDMDMNFFQSYPQKLKTVTLPEVINSAKTTVRPKDMVWLLIGDKAKIMPGLQKLGFAKIVTLDEDGNVKK